MSTESPTIAESESASDRTRRSWRAVLFAPIGDGRRRRRGSDGVRLIVAILAVVCAVLVLRSNSHPEDVITHVLSPAPYGVRWLVTLFWIGGSFGTIAFLVLMACLAKRWSVVRDLAVAAAGTLAVSGLLILALGASGGRPHSIEFDGYTLSFPVLHVALALSIATVGLPYLSRTVQRLIEFIVFLAVLATVVAGHGLPANVLGSMAIGWGVTAAIHLGWGSPLGLPSGDELRAALETVGVDAASVTPTPYQTWGAAHYVVTTVGGESLTVSFYGRDAADAQFIGKVYRLIAYRNSGPPLSLTRIHQVEHESSVTQLAARSARVPEVISASEIGPSHDAVLVARLPQGVPLSDLVESSVPDDVLDDMFAQLLDLRRARISHGAISPHTILVDNAHGTATLMDFRNGLSNASDFLLDQDLAGAMASAAIVAGSERAARSVQRVVPPELLGGALSHVRRAGLDPAVNVALKGKKQLLDQLRSRTAQVSGIEVPALVEPRRLSWNQVLVAVGSLVGGWALILVLINASHSIGTIRSAQWGWVVAAAFLCASAYLGGATSNRGSVPGALPMGRVVGLELANSFTTLAGGSAAVLATQVRFYQQQGYDTATAVTSGALTSLSGLLVKLVLFLIASSNRVELVPLRAHPAPRKPRQDPLGTLGGRDRHWARSDGGICGSSLAPTRERKATAEVGNGRRGLQSVGDPADQDRPALRRPSRGAASRDPRLGGSLARLRHPALARCARDHGDGGRCAGVRVASRRGHGSRGGGSHSGAHRGGYLEESGDGSRVCAADLYRVPPTHRRMVHPHVDAEEGLSLTRRGPRCMSSLSKTFAAVPPGEGTSVDSGLSPAAPGEDAYPKSTRSAAAVLGFDPWSILLVP